ncbi:MAG: S8 family serine peptidase [Planctomycetota bacterium]
MLYVSYYDDVTAQQINSSIETVPEAQIQEFVFGNVISVRLPLENIEILADLDEVEWVEPAPAPNTRTNVTSAQRIHVDDLWIAPYNLDGTGINVGIWDAGIIDAHNDFGNRLTIQDSKADVHWHSTHVAGTIGGSGAGNANARGMANAVGLHSWDWGNDETEMRNEAPTAGAVISNHSYGEIAGWYWDNNQSAWVDYGSGGFGNYTTVAAEWDDIVADTDLIVFKSAGNDRNDGPDWPAGPRMDGPYECISTFSNAKNIITVGATTDTDGMTNFSSWGPADDGRIKPDLCANGHSLTSTFPNNTYATFSGTSMSTPSAAGAGALLYELFVSETGNAPPPATLKALMIHGCTDLGPTGPDYQFGWGLVNSAESADLILNRDWQTSELTQTGSEITFSITVGSTTDDFKVTVVWTDPEGSPAATAALVNDLDLVLEAPDATVFLPWVLDGDNPDQNAVRGENHVDNLEQVVVESPQAGVWTVRVRGYAIPLGPQEFSIVAEGIDQSACEPPVITDDPNNQSVCEGGSAQFCVTATDALSYQWQKDDSDISGATSSCYTINPVTTADAGNYACVVSNNCGSVESSMANLTVATASVIGNTNVFAYMTTVANRRAAPYTMPEAGTIKSISRTIKSISMYHEGGSGNVLLAVYGDDGSGYPGSLIAVTPSTPVNSSAGWQTVELTSPVEANAGETVWLAWVYENNPGIRYDIGTPGRVDAGVGWSGGMPDPFGGGIQADYIYSIYATYCTDGSSCSTSVIGNTDVFPYTTTAANRRAVPYTMPEDGTLESISMYHEGGSGSMILAVYDDNGGPDALIGITASTEVNTSSGWQTIDIPIH